MSQCTSCGGICKKSGCERADYVPPEKQRHLEGFWCKDLTCKKCYSADFRFKHTAPPQRTWVGLTDEEIDQGLLRSDYAFKTAKEWRAGVVFAMTKLKEKNT